MRNLVLLFLFFLLCSCKDSGQKFNGYIDADLTYLSSDGAGRLVNLFVSRGQKVQKGQRLFRLEQTSEYFSVAMSQFDQQKLLAQRKGVSEQLLYDEVNYRRALQMRKQHAASQNDVDVAKKDLDVLRSQLNAIDFQVKNSQLNTDDKRWKARRKESNAADSGIIFDTYFTTHEFVQTGQPVLSLITRKNIKVVFFVSETALSNIFLNSKVSISSDGNPELASGTISYISNVAQYTPPIIYSREHREELIFRVEARINNPNLNQIHLGQPVSIELAQ